MSTGRITWLTERWSRGTIVETLPRLRARYGDAVGGKVELTRALIEDEMDQPRGQDVRSTLKAIAKRGRAAELDRLDAQTDCELLRESWRAFGTDRYELLPDDGLRQIARAALEAFDRPAGARSSDRFSVPLVRELASLWWNDLRHSELKRLRKLEHRRYPAIPLATGKPTESEKAQLEEEERKLLRRALRACGVRGLTDSNIDRLLNDHG